MFCARWCLHPVPQRRSRDDDPGNQLMNLIPWRRTATAREITALRQDVRELTDTIKHLAALQRKSTEQIKKLRSAFDERERAWERAVSEAVEGASVEIRRIVETGQQADAGWRKTFDAIDRRLKVEQKWRKIFTNQLSSVVRRLWLPVHNLRPPHDLRASRFRLRSQNEEDGMLFALLERAGWGACRFGEIRSWSSSGNAAVLASECAWIGLMIDVSSDAVGSGRRRFASNAGVRFVEARVTPENVNVLLEREGFAGEVDVLSIDIDSHDYWIFEALTVCSPRILILEYNALFGPNRRVTIPLGQSVDGAPKGYGGASLAALAQLASERGYRLVACEDAGVNAFFLRADVAPLVPAVPVDQAFRPLSSR